jgi:hypothetical protein
MAPSVRKEREKEKGKPLDDGGNLDGLAPYQGAAMEQ